MIVVGCVCCVCCVLCAVGCGLCVVCVVCSPLSLLPLTLSLSLCSLPLTPPSLFLVSLRREKDVLEVHLPKIVHDHNEGDTPRVEVLMSQEQTRIYRSVFKSFQMLLKVGDLGWDTWDGIGCVVVCMLCAVCCVLCADPPPSPSPSPSPSPTPSVGPVEAKTSKMATGRSQEIRLCLRVHHEAEANMRFVPLGA